MHEENFWYDRTLFPSQSDCDLTDRSCVGCPDFYGGDLGAGVCLSGGGCFRYNESINEIIGDMKEVDDSYD